MRNKDFQQFLLFLFGVSLLFACDRQTIEREAEDLDSPTMEEPPSPVPKLSQVIEALQTRWGESYDRERAFLATDRLTNWMASLKAGMALDFMNIPKLSSEQFDSLTAKEICYYYLYNPENWNQNCSSPDMEAGTTLAIYSSLPGSFENFPSERQQASIKAHREEITQVVLQCLDSVENTSVKMLELIADFDIKEAALPLIEIFMRQNPKDDLILTVLADMMWDLKYEPWSSSYLGSILDRNGSVPLTEQNVALILHHATRFAAS